MRFLMKLVLVGVFLMASLQVSSGEITEDPSQVCPIKVGQEIPQITLQDIQGKPFDLNKAVSEKPTILIFYRGSWCPYCNTHLGELKTVEDDLKKIGYQVIAVSPDLPKNLKKSVKKNDLTYRLVSDNKAEAAKALGLAFRVDDKLNEVYKSYKIDLQKASGESHRLLPVPAAILLDQKGVVQFIFFAPDYKVRIQPKVLLAAAESALAK